MISDKKRVVIVGAGMAGLTAAVYLLRNDFQVLLIDKNDKCGGLLTTFEKDGFSFDAGPRAFVNSGIMKPILKELGIKCEFLKNQISIGVEDQIFLADSITALADYKKMLVSLYPDNFADIEKIISYIAELSEYTKVLYEFDNPNFTDLMSDKKFIFRKLIPWTFKFLYALRKFNQFNMPMEDFLRQLTNNQSLIDIIIQHFFRNTPTYFALGYFYVYLDYFYPKGGTGILADLFVEEIKECGGETLLNKLIVTVNAADYTVTDSEGNNYSYDHLIWAADLKTLYRSLNLAGLNEMVTKSIELKSQDILAAKGAESVFILFLAVNRPPSFFQSHGGEHMFYTPSRKGLGETNRTERQMLVENFDKFSKADVFAWVENFCNLNTYEVSIPVLRDPLLAPEGQTGLMISCLLDYDVVKKIEDTGWYQEFKAFIEDCILNIFSETIYSGLVEDILFKFSSTPITLQKASGSSEGAITGWSFETEVPVINKLKEIPKSVQTPIPAVLQAGQWSYSPAGVPIAMLTGWYAVQNIIKSAKSKTQKV